MHPKKALFVQKRSRAKLHAPNLGNLGIYELGRFNVIRINLKKGVAPVSRWKYLDSRSGAAFFKLPNGTRVVAKPELIVLLPQAKIGRRENRVRHMLPVMEELNRRKVILEEAVGELRTKEGVNFYITKFVPGKTLSEKVNSKTLQPKTVALLARLLADAHNKGVAHGHPNGHNWIIQKNGVPRLIDVKGVTFETDYPHVFKATGRTATFEQYTQNDFNITKSWLPESMQKKFEEEYKKARGLK